MRQDTNVSETAANTDVGARVVLRVGHFDLVTNMLGHTADESRAVLIGITTRQISRARRGDAVGERFVAGLLTALKAHRETFADAGVPITFEALFKTVPGDRR